MTQLPRRLREHTQHNFLVLAIIAAVLIFHLLPITAYSFFEISLEIDATSYAITTLLATLFVLVGVFIARLISKVRIVNSRPPKELTSAIFILTKIFIYFTSIVVLPWSTYAAYALYNIGYGSTDPVHPLLNILMYVQLTLLPIVLLSAECRNKERIILMFLTVAPRLVIAAFGPRFFLIQAVLPIIFFLVYVNRGQLLNAKILLLGSFVFIFIFFLNPLLRNDPEFGLEHILVGSPINLIPISSQLDIHKFTDDPFFIPCGIIPLLNRLVDCPQHKEFNGIVAPYRFDFITTEHIRGLTGRDSIGTGGNPLIESGIVYGGYAGYLWFLVIGLLSGLTINSAFTNYYALMLYPHIVTKVVFLWRGTIVEFFDRIPFVIISAVLLLFFAKLLSTSRPKLTTSADQ